MPIQGYSQLVLPTSVAGEVFPGDQMSSAAVWDDIMVSRSMPGAWKNHGIPLVGLDNSLGTSTVIVIKTGSSFT